MSRFNKHNLAVHKFAKKLSDGNPGMSAVLFAPKFTVATDAFRLVKVSTPKGEYWAEMAMKPLTLKKNLVVKSEIVADIELPAVDANMKGADSLVFTKRTKRKAGPDAITIGMMDYLKNKKVSIETDESEHEYPAYESILEQAKKAKGHEIAVNPVFLGSILDAAKKFQSGRRLDSVKIKISGKDNPVLITAEGGEDQLFEALVMPLEE